ncbi:hypothetical protein, partial [Enterococcus faecium]
TAVNLIGYGYADSEVANPQTRRQANAVEALAGDTTITGGGALQVRAISAQTISALTAAGAIALGGGAISVQGAGAGAGARNQV